MNAELFVRGKENITLLLSLLLQDETDFYVRYHTVQILTALVAGGSHRLPEVDCLPSSLHHRSWSSGIC